ncbi:MAG: hypothetical protein SOW84_02665 [Candidatus Faecousia sp.]|nr:hypothetical protein [Candidatus Faecousia sp.]
MIRDVASGVDVRHRKGAACILAIFWFCGLLCGIFCFWIARDHLFSLMRSCIFAPVSIVGLLCAAYLPFLLSAFALLVSLLWVVYPICFCKAFLFSFLSLGFLLSFPSGGWLVRYFLLFGDCAVLPVLYWYWLHSLMVPPMSRWLPTLAAGCIVVLASCLDYRIISPYFACLIESMKG